MLIASEMSSSSPLIRNELVIVQKALSVQTQRYHVLAVAHQTRLREMEEQCMAEQRLRDDQLANILNALLLLNQSLHNEQTYIRFQLEEKDRIICKQREHLQRCCKCTHSAGSQDVGTRADASAACDSNPFLCSTSKSGDAVEDTWYTGASDAEDEPVWHCGSDKSPNFLESMNQILQNINDCCNSPPKSPVPNGAQALLAGRQPPKSAKQEESGQNIISSYYETPVQTAPNVYEIPESSSSYGNVYEQIRNNSVASNFYDTIKEQRPPALPPKPTNLTSKWNISVGLSDAITCTYSEPEYCSISELNLPQHALPFVANASNVIAPINTRQRNAARSMPPSVDACHIAAPLWNRTTSRLSNEHADSIDRAAYDLSQNFEEFKLDELECMAEEQHQDCVGPAGGEHANVSKPSFECFLEYTGLSNKCLLKPK